MKELYVTFKGLVKQKALFSLFVVCCISLQLSAQIQRSSKNESVSSTEFLEKLVKTGVTSNFIITSEHVSSTSGIRHVYLRQLINGIEVNGTESDIHIDASGNVMAVHNNFLDNSLDRVTNASVTLTAEQAINSVAQKMGYTISSLIQKDDLGGTNQKAIYNHAGISRTDIPVKLVYQKINRSEIKLAWEFAIDDVTSPEDWWNFQVDASNGTILSKQNLISQCSLSHDHSSHEFIGPLNEVVTKSKQEESSPLMAGSYNVFPIPLESPNHGTRSIVNNPDQDGTGSPFGWHDTNGVAGAEFTTTVGNNIDAFGFTTGNRADGGSGLNFNFTLDLSQTALSQENAALTNMFYMANIVHDVMYEYGFDEASGNFQENNYGNGGIGSDSVIGEGQKTGQCNAFFGTPSDGNNPTMQMYICEYGGATGDRDGDFDNGVIAHEYGHGISNRLTGGAAATGCLNNVEQMGEGWSDFFGLILTIEPGDLGTDPRGMGTWLIGQTASGAGIRTQRYDTDTNTYTYDSIKTEVAPHGVGSVWAMMLWEMTWDLIAAHGIDANVYNFTGNVAQDAGNIQALALVIEGLKLQPCSPGFIDGRDAILAADLAIYGGANQCLIWDAFARRGLGVSASQGSTGSKTDGTEAFDSVTTNIDTAEQVCVTQGPQTFGGGTPTGGIYSGTGVTDDGNGLTYTFDPNVAGIGIHTISYDAASSCGPSIATDDIEVTNGISVITCQDVTLTLDGSGSVFFDPFAAQSATIVGGNNGSGGSGTTSLQVTLTQNENISFDWLYETTDGAQYDSFGYTLNGTYTALSGTSGTTQSGTVALSLSANDVFGFTTYTVDNTFGAATGTVTNFSPGFSGQFASSLWSQVDNNSDGATNLEGASATISNTCGNTLLPNVSQMEFTCNDIGVTNVTIEVDNGAGDIGTCAYNVTIVGPTSTWDGTWDVAPTAGRKAIINSPYITSVSGNIDACACEMNADLSIASDTYVKIDGDLTVNAGTHLFITNRGSFVQVDDAASATNDGTITVRMVTPPLAEKSFMIMGSPMTAETREGVYGDAYIVRHHNTNNFIPNPDVGAAFPATENFADDNGDNWLTHTGGLNPAEGYMVFPQPNSTGSGVFTNDYTQGTLTNGVVTFPLTYHTDQNSSPNMISNPYASAIDADAFYADPANTAIDVLYFWEHITPLAVSYPGYNTANFSMGDISMYSEVMGGIPAANGGATPSSIISSGQGFAVKAASAGINATFNNAMRITGPNDTYRRPNASERDRLWINVYNDSYGLGSTTLIGFSENTTNAFEANADIKRLATPVSLYSELATGEELAINALSTFEIEASVGLSFSTQVKELQEYRISLQDVDGLHIETATVYLIDTLIGTVTNLSEGDYTFQSAEGTYSERFKVVFQDQILNTNTVDLDSVSVYPNPTQNILYIVSPKVLVQSATVYDVRGRALQTIDFSSEANKQLDISSLSNALYFVEITTESGMITKRIVKE
ncbi:M36 family metallopeptidase [Ulvibacter litoralis]|uniref:Por secretion system C-terminal sorting domain-containing protein n=1 Tax=Ulvibacter litoralis TaxID=227084 RepID=A0A1G7FWR7_9FLAO|nr:M36 family metallopeptidase [Ulvibacter litoralis]GHC64412.1 hypothetical protein GCM10008083_32070 [Ulvibacter litoralis]SDE80212.1 Por secretion system C-terminal sorting domain-containing protein [Ulvibacter litoralis]